MWEVHAEKRGNAPRADVRARVHEAYAFPFLVPTVDLARRARLAARMGTGPSAQDRASTMSHPDSRSKHPRHHEKTPHIVPDTGLPPLESPLPGPPSCPRNEAAPTGEPFSSRSHHQHDASTSQSVYFTPPQSSASTVQSEGEYKSSDEWGSDVATVSRAGRNPSDLPRRRKGKERATPRSHSEAMVDDPSLASARRGEPSEEAVHVPRPQQPPQPLSDTAKRPSRPRDNARPPASSTPQPRASSPSPPPLVRADSPDLPDASERISKPRPPGRPPLRYLNMEGPSTPSGRSFRATKDARAAAFCELCKLPFRNYSALQRHMADTKARHPFYCQDCMVEYEDFAALQDVGSGLSWACGGPASGLSVCFRMMPALFPQRILPGYDGRSAAESGGIRRVHARSPTNSTALANTAEVTRRASCSAKSRSYRPGTLSCASEQPRAARSGIAHTGAISGGGQFEGSHLSDLLQEPGRRPERLSNTLRVR